MDVTAVMPVKKFLDHILFHQILKIFCQSFLAPSSLKHSVFRLKDRHGGRPPPPLFKAYK